MELESLKINSKTKFQGFFACVFILAMFLGSARATAQEVNISLGPNKIAKNQTYKVTITVSNGQIQNYSEFPDIAGFMKRGTSSSSSTNIVNGQMSFTQSISQSYLPQKEGTFVLHPFEMDVNGKKVKSQGARIVVGPAAAQQQRNYYDPFADFFGNRTQQRQPTEFVDVKEDAFFAITTDKKEVYVGQGFNLRAAFYVALENKAPLDFYDINNQLSEILKQIKPTNCWEETFDNRLGPDRVEINNKVYQRYNLFQASYFPLNTNPIEIPAMPLKMIKYKVAKNPSFFGQNRQEDFKTFYSKAIEIKVKELPDYPLKNQVAVGQYRLNSKISQKSVKTGNSFSFDFNITGKGNIAAIDDPTVVNSDSLDIYPPNVRQNIQRSNSVVLGNKSFDYYVIPKEPGEYNLGDYFYWIYFNTATAEYDTLRPNVVLNVYGESLQNSDIMSNDLGSFYDRIDLASNRLRSVNRVGTFKIIASILLCVMLLSSLGFIFWDKLPVKRKFSKKHG
ncbi:BatD family protein [Aureibacter tunicatorum]|uniref:Oxygen tolerance protein BatD n=1 Tax=Aureibacter tunicatorum TaxID=866807 RepID=A0AAE3XMG2_9BACT|nr:BatD family protein [Aureibacter tunicatorum]MDR6238688.1 hypothetical protein [Aureibacter tunicatorum]BDD05381.1 hypothetical protein AUTU_28640 [Aureibacter tunicatorum]